MMQFSFGDRVALITGGASGLGRATALAFAEAGAHVVISDVNDRDGQALCQQIQDTGGDARYVRADVSDQEEVMHLMEAAVAAHGRIDFALNNAGIGGEQALTGDYSEATWQRVLAVNLTGVWYCMKAEIAQMLTQEAVGEQRGVIVNLASIAGLIGAPYLSAYAAAKHGVVGLTKTAALEYVRQGIRINAICPGWTDTPMVAGVTGTDTAATQRMLAGIPARRLGKPEEVAAAVLYLCSEPAAFITGHPLVLDGGIVAG
ncbi:MAG: glucose 1-dehydrogenase [Caldilineaceae bacterium]|nr:glucose 1-dehydrogenase [Caldilineaceae bacterium]MCB0138702.1 glucose 1-dehydrogenase [Caldilineaceae bacterium]